MRTIWRSLLRWWRGPIDADELLDGARIEYFERQPVLLFDHRLTADEVDAIRVVWMRRYRGADLLLLGRGRPPLVRPLPPPPAPPPDLRHPFQL